MMGDVDQLLRRAASDLRRGVRGPVVASSAIERRARRRRLTLATAVTLLVSLIGAGILLAAEPGVDLAGQGGDTLITSEEILRDGVVTEAEYRAGAEAVVSCLADAGFEVEVNFDSPRGGATFFSPGDLRGEDEEFSRCIDLHLSENVSLGWAAALGQLDVAEVRQEYTAVVACVEAKTGEDFGELTFDEFDYLTPQGRQTRDAALEYREHGPWEECYSELGLEPDSVESHMGDDPDGSAALEIVVRSGVTLTIRGPLDAPCIEVRSDAGMAGGCGVDLTKPLSVSAGGIGGQGFVSGWVSGDAAEVVVRLADGSSFEITDLVAVEGFGALFFLELVSPDEDGEIGLPIAAVALDRNGEEIGRFVLERDDEP